MNSLGERLRQARLARGLELAGIASEMRVSQRYLEALESNDISSLPGIFFARSFATQYARFLGVADKRFEAELEYLLGGFEKPPVPGQEPRRGGSSLPPIPVPGGRFSVSWRRSVGPWLGLLGVVAICSVLYSLWLRYERMPAQTGQAAEKAQSRTPAAGKEAVSPQPPKQAAQHPAAEEPHTLHIAAREATWISISSDGKQLFAGILAPSDVKRLTGLVKARVLVGNAGGVEVTFNGKPLGPIGPSGQVRLIVLTPEGSQVLKPEKPSEAASPSEESVPSPSG